MTTTRLRTAAFRGEGAEPEAAAFERLRAWAEPLGLLADQGSFLLLGRNDPPAEPGRQGYGYLYMLTIDEGLDVGEDVELIDLPANTYAVVRARLSDMGSRWEMLYRWAQASGLSVTGHGLDEHLSVPGTGDPSQMLFDLWLPVTRPTRPPN